MSWSLSRKAPKQEAGTCFTQAHQEQGAYKLNDNGTHRAVMDECAKFGAGVAEASPDGTEISISSYGHFNQDGTGSCTVTVTVGKPVS